MRVHDDDGGPGSDNMTVIIVALLQGKSIGEWYEEVGNRVTNGDGPVASPEAGETNSTSTYRH